ncbi:MAG TPA: NAD(P)/FAD-dependent oxidoreductase [Bryobacteraceae bacterium]
MSEYDVVVVGAGAAGLAALGELANTGRRVLCIEARDRIGGRIFTLRDPLSPVPIELGAEFIHGRPPEIWNAVRASRLGVYDCVEKALHIRDSVVQPEGDAWEQINRVMEEMCRAAKERDEPFASFLEKTTYSQSTKELASSFVEGFNAARKDVVGIASLAKDTKASDEINGDRSFRLWSGYDAIALHLLSANAELRLNCVLDEVIWRPGAVELHIRNATTGESRIYRARKAVITVPLGVLQSSAIRWAPEPTQALEAAAALAFGQVMRVVLRFREAFWEQRNEFVDAGFLLSNEPVFPAWWTTLAVRAPILTGWSAGSKADALLGKSREQIVKAAIQSLAKIVDKPAASIGDLLERAYFHDWQSDPFARGAYSYVPAGALKARERLAEPLDDTLYFAGEATELNGHSATVHGAIASGVRAAQLIVQSGT